MIFVTISLKRQDSNLLIFKPKLINPLGIKINVALGSLAETEYLIEFSARLGYVDSDKALEIKGLIEEVSKLLWKFKQSL